MRNGLEFATHFIRICYKLVSTSLDSLSDSISKKFLIQQYIKDKVITMQLQINDKPGNWSGLSF